MLKKNITKTHLLSAGHILLLAPCFCLLLICCYLLLCGFLLLFCLLGPVHSCFLLFFSISLVSFCMSLLSFYIFICLFCLWFLLSICSCLITVSLWSFTSPILTQTSNQDVWNNEKHVRGTQSCLRKLSEHLSAFKVNMRYFSLSICLFACLLAFAVSWSSHTQTLSHLCPASLLFL